MGLTVAGAAHCCHKGQPFPCLGIANGTLCVGQLAAGQGAALSTVFGSILGLALVVPFTGGRGRLHAQRKAGSERNASRWAASLVRKPSSRKTVGGVLVTAAESAVKVRWQPVQRKRWRPAR